jgi:hypothetical protein
VSLRPHLEEANDRERPLPLLCPIEILRRVHGSQVSKQPEDPPEPHRIEGKVENTA